MNPNNIKKNDWIRVTRSDGTIIVGKATKVGPWSKHPMITVINYHFTDSKDGLEYTSKADARKCVKAMPCDIPKGPEPAKMDDSMKDWEIGPMRKGPQMMEGYYFSSIVSYKGKKVGKIVDRGDGGDTDLEFKDYTIQQKFVDDTKKWAAANGGGEQDGYDEFWAWMTEDRLKGIDAKTFFANEKAKIESWLKGVKPVHTGNLDLVNGKV
jgi:hypothetical protein